MGHLLGYARVSTGDQFPDLQLDALRAAGRYRLFVDTASGALAAWPGLAAVLDQLRPGDTLVVWKLARLWHTLRHPIDVVGDLDGRGIFKPARGSDRRGATCSIAFAASNGFGCLRPRRRITAEPRADPGAADLVTAPCCVNTQCDFPGIVASELRVHEWRDQLALARALVSCA